MDALLLSALLLGAVQGATEFLPVSSTAHLAALPRVLGWTHPLLNSLAFDVALHVGTLLALLATFGGAWMKLARGLAAPRTAGGRAARDLALATLPALAAGAAFGGAAAGALRDPRWIACWLAVGAAVLWWADRRTPGARTAASLSPLEALAIGAAQALAILPGLSRSGATISAGLLLGLSRAEATRYSFLLSAPVIAAACAWESRNLAALPASELPAVAAGVAASALVGGLAIRWLLRAVPRLGFGPFVAYRFALALFLWAWSGRG